MPFRRCNLPKFAFLEITLPEVFFVWFCFLCVLIKVLSSFSLMNNNGGNVLDMKLIKSYFLCVQVSGLLYLTFCPFAVSCSPGGP